MMRDTLTKMLRWPIFAALAGLVLGGALGLLYLAVRVVRLAWGQ